MKKQFLAAIFTLVVFVPLFAQNRDYRQVIFGNNYEQIKEINADEFFKQYPQVKDLHLYANGQPQEIGKTDFNLFINKRVYEQKIGEKRFYRVLLSENAITDNQLIDWKNKETYFDQHVFYEMESGTLLFIGSYTFNRVTGTQFGNFPSYENVEIIQRNKKIIGIMAYTLVFNKRWTDDWIITSHAEYVLFENILAQAKPLRQGLLGAIVKATKSPRDEHLYKYDLENRIKIEASRPLVDSKRPFMYTIQNAFDGNPATSYVEDTEDDLFSINLKFANSQMISSFLLINGYAATPYLFESNGRVGSMLLNYALKSERESDWDYFADFVKTLKINDNQSIQFFSFTSLPFSFIGIFVRSVIPGQKYNDVSISELDFLTQEYGWLFGGSNE